VYRYELKITGSRRLDKVRVNPEGRRLWKDGSTCIWKEHGVWGDAGGVPRILKPDYFRRVDGRPVSFVNDYLKPFVARVAREVRDVQPRAFIFIEAVPGKEFPRFSPGEVPDLVNASHWYDVLMVYRNRYNPWLTADVYREKLVIGPRRVLRSFAEQIRHIVDFSRKDMCGGPTLIGEFGLMYKLREGRAYRTGNWRRHIQALDAYYDALDANLVGGTIWNYAADNTNLHGDNWNEEDNSVFSRDQQDDPSDINSGGRAIAGFCRPYALKTAGTPLSMRFDLRSRRFELRVALDPAVHAPTEIFVPRFQYPAGFDVVVTSGTYELAATDQLLRWENAAGAEATLTVTPRRAGARPGGRAPGGRA
jgi:hypothetical protein